MSSKSCNSIPPLKRQVQVSSPPVQHTKLECVSQRHSDLTDDDIIRSRLVCEGDHGSDDRRILTLMKIFNKSIIGASSTEVEKSFSLLYSIEHAYRLSKSTLQMNEYEQRRYTFKMKQIHKQVKQLRYERNQSDERLAKAKQRRLNLLEYNQRTDRIHKLGTRKELKTQQLVTLERKDHFQRLQQTFEANYRQRLKQIAVYMRPILEFDEILKQDIHEDGLNESSAEQQAIASISLLMNIERQRTYSDSSITSIDGDDNMFTMRSTTEHHKDRLGMSSLPTSLANNEPQPLFMNDMELYGAQLVDPLILLSSSSHIG